MLSYQYDLLANGKMIGFLAVISVAHLVMIKTKEATLAKLGLWWRDFAA